jgi:hypothetical protein
MKNPNNNLFIKQKRCKSIVFQLKFKQKQWKKLIFFWYSCTSVEYSDKGSIGIQF